MEPEAAKGAKQSVSCDPGQQDAAGRLQTWLQKPVREGGNRLSPDEEFRRAGAITQTSALSETVLSPAGK